METAPSDQMRPAKHHPDLRTHIHSLLPLAAIAGGFYLCYLMAQPFLPALTWALVLAILFFPLNRWMENRLKRRSLAATVSIVIIALMIVIPALFLAARIMEELENGILAIKTTVESGAWRHAIEGHPRLAVFAQWIENQIDLPKTVSSITPWITNHSALFVRGSIMQLVGVLLTFYFLFYFLRDRQACMDTLCKLSPLTDGEMSKVFIRVQDTIHATVYGTLAVATIQGILGGLMFWWVGLPDALLWGLVMALLGVVPVLGAFVVWIPAAVFLALDGKWGSAAIMSIWGTVVVGGIDNVLYPILVGDRLKLHTVPAFIAIVGGLLVFGTAGLILGPLALTITLALLDIWQTRKNAIG